MPKYTKASCLIIIIIHQAPDVREEKNFIFLWLEAWILSNECVTKMELSNHQLAAEKSVSKELEPIHILTERICFQRGSEISSIRRKSALQKKSEVLGHSSSMRTHLFYNAQSNSCPNTTEGWELTVRLLHCFKGVWQESTLHPSYASLIW
jgi:hypothetical protein